MSNPTALTKKLERAHVLQASRKPVVVPTNTPQPAERVDGSTVRSLPPPQPDARIEGARVCEGRIKLPSAIRDALGWSAGTNLRLDLSKPGVMYASAASEDASVVLDTQGRLQLTELGRRHLQIESGGQATLLFAPSEAVLVITNPGTVFAVMADQLAV